MSALPREHRGWAVEPLGTWTWSCSLRGIASTKAMSSLERLPQAQRSASASALPAQRIIHPQPKLGVAEVLRLVDVVEEVVHPPAGDGGPPLGELPAQRGLQPRREREEVLRRQIGAAVERARQVDERDPRSQRQRPGLAQREVAPER